MNDSTKRKATETLSPSSAKKSASITSFFAPKGPSAGSSSKNPTLKFDKAKWAASLTPEQRDLLKLEIDTLHDSWLAALKDDILDPGFLSLKTFLKKETGPVYPPAADVYSWSRHCPLNTVKVVILGQDPYHGPRQAMGMSFSVRKPVPAPPSLVNIFKGIQNDYPSFCPPPNRGGDLTPWAERGVLMLNACLTVRQGQPNSHKDKGWEKFTSKVIEVVTRKRLSGVVFMAWGTPAAQRVTKVDQKKHLVLKSVHPSPLSAHRGFFENGHFKKTNEWLQTRYGQNGPIDWSLDKSPIGLDSFENKPAQNIKPQPVANPVALPATENKRASLTAAECVFNEEEEDAMLQAVMHAEIIASSQSNGDNDDAQEDNTNKMSSTKDSLGNKDNSSVKDGTETKEMLAKVSGDSLLPSRNEVIEDRTRTAKNDTCTDLADNANIIALKDESKGKHDYESLKGAG